MNRQHIITHMEKHESSLIAYSADFVGYHNACDVVQEAFMSLYAQKQSIRNIRAWLFKVCRNKSIDLLRKDKPMHTLEHDAACIDSNLSNPAELMSQCESAKNIQELLTKLPLRQQEILRLKFHENMSYKSIADITGLSVTNIGYILHTVLKSLRNHPHIEGAQS